MPVSKIKKGYVKVWVKKIVAMEVGSDWAD